jgi:hypothetical protein
MPSTHKTSSNERSQPFLLTLSYAELSWLAGVFGQTRLALPWAVPSLPAESLRQVQDGLAGRNLIRREPGTGWKVDQLAAFLVQWLGTVVEYTRVEILRSGMEPVRIGLYQKQGLTLLAECAAQSVAFVFLPDEASLWAELVHCLDLGGLRSGRGKFLIPKAAEIVRAAWRERGNDARSQSKEAIRQLLVRSGLSKGEVTTTLGWIEALKTVIQFTHVPPKKEEPYCLLSDGKGMWAGEESGTLVGVSLKKVEARIKRILYE